VGNGRSTGLNNFGDRSIPPDEALGFMYYALRRSRGKSPAFLSVEYSFEDVPDPMIIDRTDLVPATFMERFN